jgi:hypothetical protein
MTPCHIFLFMDTDIPDVYIKHDTYVFVCHLVSGKVLIIPYKLMSKLFHIVIILLSVRAFLRDL